MELREQLAISLQKSIRELFDEDVNPLVEIPTDLSKGDFTTNVAMKNSAKLGDPMKVGEKIKENLLGDKNISSAFSKIEIAKPGFINFWLSDDQIDSQIDSLIHKSEIVKNGEQIIFEFGDPNPFKDLHIGHLRNLILGESISRLLQSQGYEIKRVNYQGDVGPHVAKAIWGIKKLGEGGLDEGSEEDKIKFLGKAYKEGAEAYAEDAKSKEEIDAINIKIYQKDSEFKDIWEKGRKISLDHFEDLYRILGVKYEKYYFESQTALLGKEIVEKNKPKVFEENDGAIIYRGEKDGLHTRVFVTSAGNPTYEAKDLALSVIKNIDYPDAKKSIIMTANEQIDYFRVVIKALEKVFKVLAQKTIHMSYGFINLKEGKMSSRRGNVVSAFWLIEEIEKRLKKEHGGTKKEVLNSTTLGSVKWSMLKFSRESDISFSIDESIDLEGNSGPYIQYAYARIQSILAKKSVKNNRKTPLKTLEQEDLALARVLCQFELVKKSAADEFSPNFLCNYLFELAKAFNRYYESNKIIGSKNEAEKLKIVEAAGGVLQNGLYLLGIEAPRKI